MIEIDGSRGEGGGQMVRSALALALVTGQAVKIDNIRGKRKQPGLRRQHLTAVQAAAEVCGVAIAGADIGSKSLVFEPRPAKAGNYRFSVGTAGSATLVLQTVLPALLLAEGPSTLILEGGTHNQWAPPFDFLSRAYLPLVCRMGPRVSARLERHGFYPAGEGRFTVQISPTPTLAGFDLLERGELVSRSVVAVVANLPSHVAARELKTVLSRFSWPLTCALEKQVDSRGPGNVVLIELEYEHVTEVFTAFGRLGTKAERVADEAVAQAQDYLASEAPVGPYLADQLMLPLGISAWQPNNAGRRGGSFRTSPLTLHAQTHLELLRQLLNIDVRVDTAADGKTCVVRLGPQA